LGEGEERAGVVVTPLDIEFRPRARKALQGLDAKNKARIFAAIELLRLDPIPKSALRLSGTSDYRIRVGDYRIIYTFKGERLVIVVIAIGHRREIYR
jgi:mRNA interferase RelE/StbE